MLDILFRSSIKDYEEAIKKDRQAIARLNSDRLSPCISDATDTCLKAVMKAQGRKSDTATSTNVEAYDKVSLEFCSIYSYSCSYAVNADD
jgi:hypothetical protein